MVSPHDEIELMIDRPVAGGRMIARHDGRVVLVSGGIPGERVLARLEQERRGVLYGAVTRVLETQSDRREVAGDWTCGGNTYAYIAYARQLALKSEIVADAFRRIARLPLEHRVAVTPSPETGYRMRTRLHVRHGRIGFFRESSHEICDPAASGQLPPGTVDVIARLSSTAAALEARGVTAVDIAENVSGNERAIHLELRTSNIGAAADLMKLTAIDGVQGATSGAPDDLPTLVFGTPHVSDAIDEIVSSPAELITRTANRRLRRQPHAFFQANRFMLRTLVDAVVRHAPGDEVVDLYAGVGLFAIVLAALGKRSVTAVEGDAVSAADLRSNAEPFGAGVIVEAMPVEGFLRSRPFSRSATVVIDPPRTGLSRAALGGLIGRAPHRIVYVACDVPTLARDTRGLIDAGYVLDSMQGFDMFPNTPHIETVAVFTGN